MMDKAVIDLLYKMADDELILGHRNSEWTGLGPIIEEDIAFSSMAQDKLGHAQALYSILYNNYNQEHPDKLAFGRNEEEFKCCQLVEYPIGEYDFSLVRHFLFDHAEYLRYQMLTESSVEDLSDLAKKISGELRYHIMHADVFIKKLGAANAESNTRMQNAINEIFPLALGIFEESEFEQELIDNGIFKGEKALQEKWLESITPVLEQGNLTLPVIDNVKPAYGGRKGSHTEHLKPLLEEMTEVYSLDPAAEW